MQINHLFNHDCTPQLQSHPNDGFYRSKWLIFGQSNFFNKPRHPLDAVEHILKIPVTVTP